jgi:hypothetical protein
MQPITFPDDGFCVSTGGDGSGDGGGTASPDVVFAAKKSSHRPAGKGCIQYGESQEIRFKGAGNFYTDRRVAFTKPLPEGYLEASSVVFSSHAVYRDETITLVFNDDNGSTWIFELSVRAVCK